MDRYNAQQPSRSDSTTKEYVYRYEKMRLRFMRETRNEDVGPEEVTAHLLLNHSTFTSMSSWRKAKASVLYVLETYYPGLEIAIDALRAESSIGLPKTSAKTSGRKKKGVPVAVWRKLQTALKHRATQNYKHSKGTLDVLTATLLTGLRPNEWSQAAIGKHEATGRTILIVKNSKHTNGRANGEFRSLFIDELNDEERASIKAAIAYCEARTEIDADRIQLALKQELEATRDRILVRSKLPASSITLYSFRHQFIANAKATFDDPALVAALAGHASTKTASLHYGKRANSTGQVKVSPTPEAVEAVHTVRQEVYKSFVAGRVRRDAPGYD